MISQLMTQKIGLWHPCDKTNIRSSVIELIAAAVKQEVQVNFSVKKAQFITKVYTCTHFDDEIKYNRTRFK